MTDFLTNLAARTIAPPTLRPRTRMRFEPVEDAPPAMDEPVAAAEGTTLFRRPLFRQPADPPRRSETRRPTQHAASVPATPSPHAAEVAASHESAPPPQTRVIAGSHDVPVVEVRVPQERTVTVTREKRVVVPGDRRVVVVEQQQENVAQERPPARAYVEASSAVRQPPSPLSLSTTTAAAARGAARQSGELPDRAPAARTPTRGSTRVVNRTEHTREMIGTHTREQLASPPAAEPTIHVSIGRVEVRAVAPPAPPPRAQAQKPMSIDDYMARREAKERR